MTVVLPEGHDARVLRAAARSQEDGLARIILLGESRSIISRAASSGLDITGVEIVNPETSDLLPYMGRLYCKLREQDCITEEDGVRLVRDPVLFGVFLVSLGLADGCVAGADTATVKVLRAALNTIGVSPGVSTVSGAFLMVVPEERSAAEHALFFADCAVMPRPGPSQLASVAMVTASTRRTLVGDEPVVAMLSFSTKGSAAVKETRRVVKATNRVREEAPDLRVDGELQVDAALVPSIAERKVGASEAAGQANVLIFPDLDAGNICYKLVERLCGARAVGPILQGLAKPVNDLSRGASVDDIVDLVAVTVVQAQSLE
jgi:phosphate acetyltransferase